MLNLTKALQPVIVKTEDGTEFVFSAPDKFDDIAMAELGIKRQDIGEADKSGKLNFTKDTMAFVADRLIEVRNVKINDAVVPSYSDKNTIRKFFLTMPQSFIADCLKAYSERMAMSENFPID